MNARKLFSLSSVFVITVLIALGGFWQPAAAKSRFVFLVEGQTIGMGGQGLHVTNIPLGVSQVYLDNVGTELPPQLKHELDRQKIDMRYRAPAMEVRFLDAKGGEVEQIEALVYVYFSIGRAERDLWHKSGMEEIAIWFANEETGDWEMCPTYFVRQNRWNGTVGRLACLAPGSGYYVIGQGDFSQYVNSQMTVDTKAQSAYTLKVRAYIDGRSQLIIRENIAYWHHLDFAAPGRHYFYNEPTYLNKVRWEPTWPDKPDAENRDCNCNSSSYEGVPSLARSNQTVSLYVVQGRGEVFILQQPAAANDYTLIVELDDNPLDGPEWYEVNLSYIGVTSG